MGERYLRREFPNKKIDSAGTGALVGYPADASAEKVANINGLSLEGHRAQQFTADLARYYELILVMEKYHLEKIAKIAPEAKGNAIWTMAES